MKLLLAKLFITLRGRTIMRSWMYALFCTVLAIGCGCSSDSGISSNGSPESIDVGTGGISSLSYSFVASPSPGLVNGIDLPVERQGGSIPTDIIQGQHVVGNIWMWNNMWGVRGHDYDYFKQSLFENQDGAFGYYWNKGQVTPVWTDSSAPACMYSFSFLSVHYGVTEYGFAPAGFVPDMPVQLDLFKSFIGTHDISYAASDYAPGYPGPIYPRHALVYDLFLTTAQPSVGTDVSGTITDEVIIMLNFNPEYPDIEACSTTSSAPLEANAVFDGFNTYDYHSFDPNNAIGQNYHQFRLVGGNNPGNPIPRNLDIIPFWEYIKARHNLPNLWLGSVVMGTQIYDHTHGSVTYNSLPTFVMTPK